MKTNTCINNLNDFANCKVLCKITWTVKQRCRGLNDLSEVRHHHHGMLIVNSNFISILNLLIYNQAQGWSRPYLALGTRFMLAINIFWKVVCNFNCISPFSVDYSDMIYSLFKIRECFQWISKTWKANRSMPLLFNKTIQDDGWYFSKGSIVHFYVLVIGQINFTWPDILVSCHKVEITLPQLWNQLNLTLN